MRKAEELYMKHIYATEGQVENSQNSPVTSDVIINEVNATQKLGQYSQRAWRSKENSEIPLRTDNFQIRTQNKDNSYPEVLTHTY